MAKGDWEREELGLDAEALREEEAKEEEGDVIIDCLKSARKRPLIAAPTVQKLLSTFTPPPMQWQRRMGELLSLALGAALVVNRVLLLS